MDFTNFSPKSDQTRNRIIEAASKLFSEKGYAGSTTRAIAEKAGVNEVTLFRHFGSKENLAREIMNQFGGLAIAENFESHLSGNYRQDLYLIGGMMLKVMTERNDAMRMAICESGNFPEFREIVAENPRQLRQMLARYFQTLMEKKEIREGHPELLAQAFLGMFFSYTVLQGFLLDNVQPEVSSEEIVSHFVELFINGTLLVEE
jgi:AcrR family transcriptional regulator